MQTYSNLIDNKQLLDFSQHFSVQRTYMGSAMLPDRKTEYIEQEYRRVCENGNLPMIAKVHAFDTEAAIGGRVPIETVSIEELLIKEKINVSESIARFTHGMRMENDSLVEYIFDDIARTAEKVVTRAELAKMDAIAKGKFVINENNLSFTVDYGVPKENFVSSDWTDKEADILGDIRNWRLIAVSKGVTPNIAITTEKVLLSIMANSGIQKAIFGTSGVGILPTLDQVNALLASQFGGLRITTNEARYGTLHTVGEKTTVAQNRFFPEDTFVMTATGTDGTLGIGLWGVTPEEMNEGGAFDSKRQMQFVTCTTWDTPDPVATWTKASGLFVPVLPNIYGHIIANVNPAADSSEKGAGETNSEG